METRKNNKDYHNYKINDTTTVRIYIEEETMHGFTKAEEIINDYEKKKQLITEEITIHQVHLYVSQIFP